MFFSQPGIKIFSHISKKKLSTATKEYVQHLIKLLCPNKCLHEGSISNNIRTKTLQKQKEYHYKSSVPTNKLFEEIEVFQEILQSYHPNQQF